MKTIWKFSALVDDFINFEMPVGAEILHVGVQAPRQLCFWVEVDSKNPKETRNFRVFDTGHKIIRSSEFSMLDYLGTVMDNPFVWHVYEEV